MLKSNFIIEGEKENKMLVYKLAASEKVDYVSTKMMSTNNILGVLPVSVAVIDSDISLKYPIKTLKSLDIFFAKHLFKKEVISLLLSMVEVFTQIEDYMLLPSCIILDEKFIFVDERTVQINFGYLPLETECQTIDAQSFFQKIIGKMQFEVNEQSNYLPKLLNFINNKSKFSCCEFRKLLQNLSIQEDKCLTISNEIKEIEYVKPQEEPIRIPVLPIETEIIETKEEASTGLKKYFGLFQKVLGKNEEVAEENPFRELIEKKKQIRVAEQLTDEKKVNTDDQLQTKNLDDNLNIRKNICIELVRKSTGERIVVDKDSFKMRLANTRGNCEVIDDVTLYDNYFEITRENELLYIRFHGSNAHCFLNNYPLLGGEYLTLMHEDCISFGDEKFIVFVDNLHINNN